MTASLERAIKTAGVALGTGVVWVLLGPLGTEQRAVGTVFALTVGLWITELLPLAVTALGSTALLVLVAGVGEKAAFGAYGDPIIPLFIGSFLLAKGMQTSGLDRRFAWMILSRRFATRSSSMLLFSLGAIACVISLFVSNTATTAMLLPIGLAIVRALGVERRGHGYALGVMMMLTWGSSIAVGVPVGTPPNLIGIAMIEESTGVHIGFLQWLGFGMPITVLMLLGCWVVLRVMYGRNAPSTEGAAEIAAEQMQALGPLSRVERNVLLAFLTALVLWVLPDLLVLTTGEAEWATSFQTHVPASVAAIVAALLLFTTRAEGRPTLTWQEGATIDWGTILLFGGGIALGKAMFDSKLAESLGRAAATASGANTLWTITALSIAAAILLSELASNTAAATALVPVAIGLAEGAGVNPIAPALGVALGASLGFMLPVSTPPNAIVYSSGLVPSKEMMRAGLVIDVLGFVVTFGCLRVLLPLLGWV